VLTWLRQRLGGRLFQRPDDAPASGCAPSVSADRVEAAAEEEVDEWADEWEKPVTTDEAWTPPTVSQSAKWRWDAERKKDWWGLGLVLLICCALYLPFLGTFGLWDPWETHYGEVSRHMTETNDYISPWWGSHWSRPGSNPEGSGFYSKPILVLWAMALGMEVWGWTDFAIRIGVALMALLAVALTYMMGAGVWNRRTGAIIALVLATSPFFFFLSRQTQTDMPFVAMLVGALALFMLGAFGKDRRKPADRLHYLLFFVSLLVLVLPQLRMLALDQGFNESQRNMRPGLRAQGMNDFKGEAAFMSVVWVNSPRLSPSEREALAAMPPQEAEAAIAASRSWLPDFILELGAPFLVVLVVFGLLAVMGFWAWRGRLSHALFDAKGSRGLALFSVWLALLVVFLGLALNFKRIFAAYGMNWESAQGAAFNLAKFGGVALSLLLLGLLGLLFSRLVSGRLSDRAWVVFGGAMTLLLAVSPMLLVMKHKALGLDGYSFWAEESFGARRLLDIFLASVYGPLLVGLFVMAALFVYLSKGARFWEGRSPRVLWSSLVLTMGLVFLCVSVFYVPVSHAGNLSTFGKVAGRIVGAFFQWGPVQVALYALCVVVVALSLFRSKRKTVGQMCFLSFYIFAALATLAKGLLGFALPGAIIFFYLIVTVEWKRLLEFEIPRGILTFIAVGVPWYAAMLILHENAYFQRFFVHDHFKRLASGVHQIDSGTFEHFIHWLGYGLFPWAALVPAVVIRLGVGRGLLLRDDRSRATLMLAIWAAFAFALFSLSSTKFHHYTFPVVPPLAILVGLLVAEMWENKVKRFGAILVSALAMLVLIGWDVVKDPTHWKNLFTYKYDREWIDFVPEYTARLFGEPTLVRGAELQQSFQNTVMWITVVCFVGLALWFVPRLWFRRAGVTLVMGGAVALTAWGLFVYMPAISPTWSQRGVWMSYWNDCTRIPAPPNADPKKIWCEESSLIYRITWRGERYYSQNEAVPLTNDDDMRFFVSYNGETPFYVMTDRTRYCLGSDALPNFGADCKGGGSIVNEVRKFYPGRPVDHELMWDDNYKFVMVKFYPGGKAAPPPLLEKTFLRRWLWASEGALSPPEVPATEG